jgi:hypothetical protein
MKCPACGQMLNRIEGVCGEYICINPECPENKKAHVQAYAEFYGLTQAEIYENYRRALTKNRREK